MSYTRDGYARWVLDRGKQIQDRHQALQRLTPDRMALEVVAETAGNGVVRVRCGEYRLLYGVTQVADGFVATYLPDRSRPIPGVDPSERALMGAAVDAHMRALAAQRGVSWPS